jgi:predicted ATPase
VRDTVGTLLDRCPELIVLATSRAPLGLAAESVCRLAPLPLPNGVAGEALRRVPSVALFLDRAERVRPGFAARPDELSVVADVVRRLDGMPLAIELAAGRLSTFALPDLRDRLDRSLDLLGAGRPSGDARHRTLRSTVEWSYALLPEPERRLFRHLAVFPDGVDLGTAERIAAELDPVGEPGRALAHLVDASMLDAVFERGTRYRMLETLRAFGLDRLGAAGETDAAHARLLRWAVELVRSIAATAETEREPEADAVLRREAANLRAAWRRARTRSDLDTATTMAVSLYEYAGWREFTEVKGWSLELSADPALDGHPRAAAVLGVAAHAAYHAADPPRSERLARAGLAHEPDRAARSICHTALAMADLSRSRYDGVALHALAAAADTDRPALQYGLASIAALYGGDPERARVLHARMAEVVDAGPPMPTIRGFTHYVAGEIDGAAGHPARAEEHYLKALALSRAAGSTFITGIASVGLMTVRARAGRTHDALRGYRDVVDYFAGAGNWTHLWVTLRNLAALLRELGDVEPADLLDAAADAAPDAPPLQRAGVPGPAVGRARALEAARAAIARNLAAGGPDPG